MSKTKIISVLIFALFACQFLLPADSECADTTGIEEISGSIVEDILQGIKTGDYAKYSKDFSQHLKAAIPESKFRDISIDFTSQFGEYLSKEFLEARDNTSFIAVFYRAKFSKENQEVIVKVNLERVDDYVYVMGISFEPTN